MNVEKEIEQINKAINELVYQKTALQKAYNYYHYKRDADQFKHIEENYGIGVPTSIDFNPLVRPHIDRLIGEYLGLNPDLKITCKDSETISNIMREKQLTINKSIYDYLKRYLENNIIGSIINKQESSVDPLIESELKKIVDNIDESFISQYEIAAQNILDYIKQSESMDINTKMWEILADLAITGTCYYRTRPTVNKDDIKFEVLNPVNTFVEKNPNSNYLADSRRAVVRKYMSVEDILSEYRDDLKEEYVKILKDNNGIEQTGGPFYYIRGESQDIKNIWDASHTGILGGLETHPTWPGESSKVDSRYYSKMWVIYEVEWIEVDYKTGIQTRHEGVKIGEEIYITRGESPYIIRSKENPKRCRLSVNGLFLLDKNGEPNSIIINTMNLQDKYDLLAFYRDNLIANSGTVGDWVDLAYVPQILGVELPERLQKWLAYKKQGIGLIDSSQEGAQMMNTIFNGFDDTVKAQSIQAISLAMKTIEQTVSMTTGILPEALAQYEQRDAVSNVQLGVRTSLLLTKQFYKAMDNIYKSVNYDLLNIAKLVWNNGLKGTIVLGKYAKIFTALPKYYTTTDFDIHIEDSTKSYQNIQALISVAGELIKGGVADLSDITNIITATSITELKRDINKSILRKKEENNIIIQLQQQVKQYETAEKEWKKQIEELQNKINQLNSQLEKNNHMKWNIESEKIEIEKEKIKNDKDYNDKIVDVKRKQLEVQVSEIYDNNPYNDKIKSTI